MVGVLSECAESSVGVGVGVTEAVVIGATSEDGDVIADELGTMSDTTGVGAVKEEQKWP